MVHCKENYKFDVGVKGLKTEYFTVQNRKLYTVDPRM